MKVQNMVIKYKKQKTPLLDEQKTIDSIEKTINSYEKY